MARKSSETKDLDSNNDTKSLNIKDLLIKIKTFLKDKLFDIKVYFSDLGYKISSKFNRYKIEHQVYNKKTSNNIWTSIKSSFNNIKNFLIDIFKKLALAIETINYSISKFFKDISINISFAFLKIKYYFKELSLKIKSNKYKTDISLDKKEKDDSKVVKKKEISSIEKIEKENIDTSKKNETIKKFISNINIKIDSLKDSIKQNRVNRENKKLDKAESIRPKGSKTTFTLAIITSYNS